ncbi:hypothetical protein [Jiangella alba]|nr:hypothetical protein [Jiangella alba]
MERGAKRLGFTGRSALKAHQLEWDEILEDAHETTAMSEPRRTGKTTALWCRWIGLCEERDDFMILTSAQSGIMARRRFLGMARLLERHHPHADGGPKINKSVGHESFEWANGSMLWVVPPKDKSVRGDAADVAFLDEQQELDAEVSYDLRGGIMPLFDTRDDGRVVLAGTPGKVRAGWFWDSLEAGRNGKPGHTLIEDAAQRGQDVDNEALWPLWHPGLRNGLTTLDKLRARRAGMDKATWAREYCGQWPGTDDKRALSEEKWTASGLDIPVAKPERFSIAFDVEIDSSSAALVAAWRDDDGVAYVELLEHGSPADVGREALRVSLKYRIPVHHDSIGANLKVAEGLERARPKPKVSPLIVKDMHVAASTLVEALDDGKLRHFKQPGLDNAAEAAAWRNLEGGQLFARRASKGPVAPVVAASEALLAFDRLPVIRKSRIIARRAA